MSYGEQMRWYEKNDGYEIDAIATRYVCLHKWNQFRKLVNVLPPLDYYI